MKALNKRNALNDNEPLPFQTLAAATARALENLTQQHETAGEHADDDNTDKENAEQRRAYVDQRLKDFAAFERRASGETVRRR